jgi:hypothetical protein
LKKINSIGELRKEGKISFGIRINCGLKITTEVAYKGTINQSFILK